MLSHLIKAADKSSIIIGAMDPSSRVLAISLCTFKRTVSVG